MLVSPDNPRYHWIVGAGFPPTASVSVAVFPLTTVGFVGVVVSVGAIGSSFVIVSVPVDFAITVVPLFWTRFESVTITVSSGSPARSP